MLGNIMVTGGAGFIGSQLISKLLPISQHIYVLDDLSTGNRAAVPVSDKVTFIEGSILDRKILKDILPKVEYIFHLACANLIQSVSNIDRDFQVNLYGQLLLLQDTYSHCPNLKRFIYTSTASIYSDAALLPTPESYYEIRLPYAASKFSAEHYCNVYYHMYGLPTSILRLSNVFGPGQTTINPYCGVVAKFFEASLQRQPLTIYGDGQQTRDFTYIDDALDAILLAAVDCSAIGKTYNVGTGIETSVNDLADKVLKVTNNPVTSIEYEGKRPVDIVRRRSVDTQVIKNDLHWKSIHTLTEGLEKTYQWLKKVRE
ncbi:epimerase [Desulfuribacillus stibiiarsenatis]|uniref:Epimerase n=1 Tax=Desulfuribacillus stibiiarsenatis TaxID=1390249 RepID=A0A1E5L8R3_9FIRM|nr:NAD-dependent epimerase/dehydratase family protein [Desulfuribacillus stibiiarsenatis]OEH86535.1 epimerase [Desulfuribacillus stibiiarsenatis]